MYSRYSRRSNNTGTYVIVGIVLFVVVVLGAFGCASYAKTSTVNLHVTGKESVSTGSDHGHEYRVYTTSGTYKVGDSWVHPRFNSSDVYGSLKEDTDYRCEVYGWRIPLFSQFKNILHCEQS